MNSRRRARASGPHSPETWPRSSMRCSNRPCSRAPMLAGSRTALQDGELLRWCRASRRRAAAVRRSGGAGRDLRAHGEPGRQKVKGQFFTPRHVVAEVVKMMQPQAQDRVLIRPVARRDFCAMRCARLPSCSVFGFDIDLRVSQVARVMLAASGQSPARIQRADSLRRRVATPGRPFLPWKRWGRARLRVGWL